MHGHQNNRFPPMPTDFQQFFCRSSPVHLGPLVALHGGPSWPHNYLLPLKYLACHGVSEVAMC